MHKHHLYIKKTCIYIYIYIYTHIDEAIYALPNDNETSSTTSHGVNSRPDCVLKLRYNTCSRRKKNSKFKT